MHLFEPLTVREVALRNRIVVSPMCQYSSIDGKASDWHLVHLGSRAIGGAGLVMTEAAAVEARGRISPQDLGIYDDSQVAALQAVTPFIQEHGAVAGIQLAHAGRKASTRRPWEGHGYVSEEQGGWCDIVAPGKIPFADLPPPQELDQAGIKRVIHSFGEAAKRSLDAGFRLIEIHAAHGYLIHQFLSPLSNPRTDEYGGDFTGRIRFLIEIVQEIRRYWPERLPLFVRISATDWAEGGWDLDQSVELSRRLQPLGVDAIDCSSGGTLPRATIPVGPGYQTCFAERIRRETGILTAAVGMITAPEQADHIVRTGQADMVVLARELLRNPYWPLLAAQKLGQAIPAPPQYERAW